MGAAAQGRLQSQELTPTSSGQSSGKAKGSNGKLELPLLKKLGQFGREKEKHGDRVALAKVDLENVLFVYLHFMFPPKPLTKREVGV